MCCSLHLTGLPDSFDFSPSTEQTNIPPKQLYKYGVFSQTATEQKGQDTVGEVTRKEETQVKKTKEVTGGERKEIRRG